MMLGQQDLKKGAVDMAIRKSMEDLQTLLRWAETDDDIPSRIMHIERAIELLCEIRTNLESV